MSRSGYEIVIGLEVHAQLLTRSKLFCGDSTAFGAAPNTQVSAISLGHPGTLPRLNREAITLAVKLGLATNCTIVQENYFARKNYFYPDLPKGYQVSQHTTPICRNGHLDLPGGNTVRINRIHIEEDAGKMVHEGAGAFTGVDYNRAGMPLLEIVTEPDLRSAEEAAAFVTLLRQLVRHLGVCDGNMEEGSLRCDVNISVRKEGDTRLGTKVEIKNLNSIRFIRKAVEHESARLVQRHRQGEPILQETRGLRESDFSTYPIRVKEDEDDYRYFPEPDLPVFYLSAAAIDAIRAAMPSLPEAEKVRLQEQYGLTTYDAMQLAADPGLTTFFEGLVKLGTGAKAAANWLLGPVRRALAEKDQDLGDSRLSLASLAQLAALVEENSVSFGMASGKVLPALLEDPGLDLFHFIETNNLGLQTSGDSLDPLIEAAIDKHRQKITEYKKGKKGLLSLFVGEVMKRSGGRADARLVAEKIIEKLNQCD